MGAVQGTYIGREERALFEQAGKFCVFIWHVSLKEGEQASSLHGDDGEWPVTSSKAEASGVSSARLLGVLIYRGHPDVSRAGICGQQERAGGAVPAG